MAGTVSGGLSHVQTEGHGWSVCRLRGERPRPRRSVPVVAAEVTCPPAPHTEHAARRGPGARGQSGRCGPWALCLFAHLSQSRGRAGCDGVRPDVPASHRPPPGLEVPPPQAGVRDPQSPEAGKAPRPVPAAREGRTVVVVHVHLGAPPPQAGPGPLHRVQEGEHQPLVWLLEFGDQLLEAGEGLCRDAVRGLRGHEGEATRRHAIPWGRCPFWAAPRPRASRDSRSAGRL